MITSKRFANREAALAFVDTLPINTLRYMLAEFLTANAVDKIVISEEQFKQFFKIRGYKDDGQVENRGRRKKIDEGELFEEPKPDTEGE